MPAGAAQDDPGLDQAAGFQIRESQGLPEARLRPSTSDWMASLVGCLTSILPRPMHF